MRYDRQVREVVESRALLSDSRFGSLWLSQGISQTAQNALLFTLLVVVLNITGSSVHTSFLVFSFIIPSIPLGMVVGVLLDRLPKGPVLVSTNLLRAGGCILYFFFHENVWVIYAISVGQSASGLFFNPAAVALIPSLVPKNKLVQANSLYNFTLTGSQLLGIVFLAPILLKSGGPNAMFLAGAAAFTVSALACLRLSSVREDHRKKRSPGQLFAGMSADFRKSWQVITSDPIAFMAIGQMIMSSTLVLLFAVLIPRYMRDTLEIPPDNAAFVFAPTGIGALIGLRFIPWLSRKDKGRVIIIGLTGIAICLVLLALVQPLAEITKQAPGPLNPTRFLRMSLLQTLTMAIAGPLGFCYALLNAPAQTVLHERAPPDMRGRIFAAQVVSANFISLLPLLVVGGVTDLLGITAVLALIAAVVLLLAIASRFIQERWTSPPASSERPRQARSPVDTLKRR